MTRPSAIGLPVSTGGEQPVSVVMPVYNVAPFIDAAIASILHQSHREFEFLIRDDGSTDETADLLDRWVQRDNRIKVFRDGRQLGPAASSNWIVQRARNEFVARMDGDDISHPDRLRRQVEVLLRHSDVSLVGTLFRTIDVNGRVIRSRDRSRLSEPSLLAPFAHGSIMYRRSAFDRTGGYRSACDFWEDQDLFLRMARLGRVLVLPEPLFDYRFNLTSTRLVSDRKAVERAVDLGLRCLEDFAATGDYEERLCRGPHDPVDPRAIVSVAQLELWAYRRPYVFKRLLTRARLKLNCSTLSALLWALAAWLHPPFLRSVSRCWAWARDALVGRHVLDSEVYEWPVSRFFKNPPTMPQLIAESGSRGPANHPCLTADHARRSLNAASESLGRTELPKDHRSSIWSGSQSEFHEGDRIVRSSRARNPWTIGKY